MYIQTKRKTEGVTLEEQYPFIFNRTLITQYTTHTRLMSHVCTLCHPTPSGPEPPPIHIYGVPRFTPGMLNSIQESPRREALSPSVLYRSTTSTRSRRAGSQGSYSSTDMPWSALCQWSHAPALVTLLFGVAVAGMGVYITALSMAGLLSTPQ